MPCPIAGAVRVSDVFWFPLLEPGRNDACPEEILPGRALEMDILKTHTKLLAGFNTSLLVGAALVLLAGTAPASAHTPEVDPTCTGLTVTLENYGATAGEPTPNAVTVVIDGDEVANVEFGAAFSGSYDFADTTTGHEYAVTVDARDNAYDRFFEGTTDACVTPPAAADALAAVRVLPPTCDVPARLVLDAPVNATWSTPTAVTGPADYSVVATAVAGHTFATGDTTASFTGHLDGQLDSVEAGCHTSPGTVPPKPEPTVTNDAVESEDCATETITTTTTTVSTGWALNEDTNTWQPTPPVTTVATADRDATAQECPTPAAVTPTVDDELASTGADNGWLLAVAGTLLAAGMVLMVTRRIRRA